MVYAGIDYSMTCPAICIWDSAQPLEFKNCQIFFIKKEPKFCKDYSNIHGIELPYWNTQEERFDKISDIFLQIMQKFNVKKVCLEGYAMGSSKGLVFNIAEHGGLLKHKMYKANIEFITPAPTQVKKFWTEKGNAKKDLMHDTLLEKENISVEELIGLDKLKSPVSDVVDSYAMLQYLIKVG
jgi:putative uncharacterized protein 24